MNAATTNQIRLTFLFDEEIPKPDEAVKIFHVATTPHACNLKVAGMCG